jgi:hypothetical protein
MKSKGGRGGRRGKGSPHKQQQTKRPSNNEPGTPSSEASNSKRPKQVGNQQSIMKYISTDAGSYSGTNESVLVAREEAMQEQQQDDEDIMVIDEVPPLSPPKVSCATSEAVLTELPSEQQQESPSMARPTSDQAAEEDS